CAGLADPATMTPPPTVHGDLAAPATSVIGTAIARDRRRVLADLLALAKPRVVLMILVTTAVGYYAGLTGAPDYARLLHVLVGTLLAACGPLPLHQYGERPVHAPVIGWVAAREGFGVGAWVLFAILFLWQLPHTLAIARLYRDDYARAGVRLLPVVDADGSSTERQIVTGCLALLVVSLLPTLIGIAGPVYFVGAFLLGAAFVALGARQALVPSTVAARRVLFASLLYLPALLALLAFDKVC